MTKWNRDAVSVDRARKQSEREAVRRQRDLLRQIRDQEKADEKEKAFLAWQSHLAEVDVLLSIHREAPAPVDWLKLASALPPAVPTISRARELNALRNHAVRVHPNPALREAEVTKAQSLDAQAFADAQKLHREAVTEWQSTVALARRILARDCAAYTDALVRFSTLQELADLGAELDFTMHTADAVECVLSMKGTQVVPTEAKSLTATGKLAVKPMPRQQFQEIYQDYLCGGVLRVAREAFAVLPIRRILVTASAPTNGGTTVPVLSAAIDRSALDGIDFEKADASDTLDRFSPRGDFKASRKTGAFQAIEPLAFKDIAPVTADTAGIPDLLVRVSAERAAIRIEKETIEEAFTS
ncbi:MAG: hypothetical protein KBC32_11105 [Candidatus Didemnitutus sp.]|nr:hypothetical protein [Candidatus Didemnitutus sp.]